MMLNTKKRPLIAAALLLTSFGITTSCIDNSYDLNRDIDMTISAGGEHLAIPVGYTEKITLDKIIELDEGDDLQIVDGEYHLLKKDNIDETNTSVKLVTVNESSNPIEPIRIISGNHDSDVYDINLKCRIRGIHQRRSPWCGQSRHRNRLLGCRYANDLDS